LDKEDYLDLKESKDLEVYRVPLEEILAQLVLLVLLVHQEMLDNPVLLDQLVRLDQLDLLELLEHL
jgi:hypothetical protein